MVSSLFFSRKFFVTPLTAVLELAFVRFHVRLMLVNGETNFRAEVALTEIFHASLGLVVVSGTL